MAYWVLAVQSSVQEGCLAQIRHSAWVGAWAGEEELSKLRVFQASGEFAFLRAKAVAVDHGS